VSTDKTKADNRPHRRVLLTQPSTPASVPTLTTSTYTDNEPSPAVFTPEGEQTRMTVFLKPTESEKLEEVWVGMRLSPARPSKGDIVRAAMALAFEDTERLEREIRRRKGV
jgi:hypothetical protein